MMSERSISPILRQDEVFSEEEEEDSSDEEDIIDVDKFTRTEYYAPGNVIHSHKLYNYILY